MKFPEDVFYTPDHEWIKFGKDNTAIVGVTNFAQKELGDIVYVDIETEGQQIEQNDVFGTIEAVKTVSDLFLPVSGKVLEINPIIISAPETINTDPYGDGWIIKIAPSDNTQKTNLLSNLEYQELVG